MQGVARVAEYLERRCSDCPQVNSPSMICPILVGVQQPGACSCRFVRAYLDNCGQERYVRSGAGLGFKTYFLRIGGLGFAHACRQFSWRKTFDEAQADLNRYAKKNRWAEVAANGKRTRM